MPQIFPRRTAAALALVLALALAGCGGGDGNGSGKAASPKKLELESAITDTELAGLPAQRGAAPSVRTDPYVFAAGDAYVYNVQPGESDKVARRLEQAGFVSSVVRYFGQAPGTASSFAPTGYESLLQFRDAAAAKREAREQHDASLAPCPKECALKSGEFVVRGIPGATGTTATRQMGSKPKIYEYQVVFAKGPVVASVWVGSDDRSGLKDAVVAAARGLYGRVPSA